MRSFEAKYTYPWYAVWPVALVVVSATAFLALTHAWLADDAFITLRSVRNLTEGLGFGFNPNERVQAYTHPLWALLLVGPSFLFRDPSVAVILLSIFLSCSAVTVLLHGAFARPKAISRAVFLLCALAGSKAFFDYTSSGLENPLSYFLLAIFLLNYLAPEPTTWTKRLTFLAASLCVLNRLDTILLFAPALTVRVAQSIRTNFKEVFFLSLWFLLPLLAWHTFSLVYYGFPLPNTFYAKVTGELDRWMLLDFGFRYFKYSLFVDPLTLPLILVSLVFLCLKKESRYIALALGVLLYFGYVLWIGGDFMNGRFFAVPFFFSLGALALRSNPKNVLWILSPVCLAVTLIAPHSPVWSDKSYKPVAYSHEDGIADERGGYFPYTGLIRTGPKLNLKEHEWYKEGLKFKNSGKPVKLYHAIGFFGWAAGTKKPVYDLFGLSSPFIARMPVDTKKHFRPGHVFRKIPGKFIKSETEGKNLLKKGAERDLYNDIELITKGPLFSKKRWKAIRRVNTQDAFHQRD